MKLSIAASLTLSSCELPFLRNRLPLSRKKNCKEKNKRQSFSKLEEYSPVPRESFLLTALRGNQLLGSTFRGTPRRPLKSVSGLLFL